MSDVSETRTVAINGRDYAVDALSDVAKAQIANLRVVDAEIARLTRQVNIHKTARAAYARVLAGELENEVVQNH